MKDHVTEAPAVGMLVWWFIANDGRLRKPLPDGTRPRLEPQVPIVVPGPSAMQDARLRAREHVLDALLQGVGLIVCRARLDGIIMRDRWDNLYASSFTPLWIGDAHLLIHHFVCDLAVRDLVREQENGRDPDPLWWRAVEEKRRWLRGGITRGEYHHVWQETLDFRHAQRRQNGTWGHSVVTGALWPGIDTSPGTRQQIKQVFLRAMQPSGLGLTTADLDAELECRLTDAFAQFG